MTGYNPLTVALHYYNANKGNIELRPLVPGRLAGTWTLQFDDDGRELVTVYLDAANIGELAEVLDKGLAAMGRSTFKAAEHRPAITLDQARKMLSDLGFSDVWITKELELWADRP